MEDRWEEDIKLTLQVLEECLHNELSFIYKMVLLTHFLADFTKVKGGLASGFSP